MLSVSSVVINTLVEILLDAIIFNILYSTMNYGYGYLKNVLIYAVCMEIKIMIIRRTMAFPFLLSIFSTYFLLSFIFYFIIGFGLIYLLDKLYDLLDKKLFIIIGILIQFGITSFLNLLLLNFYI